MSWVYLFPRASGDPCTVGHYSPDGTWNPESDHPNSDEAAKRVHYLNGGTDLTQPLNSYGEGIGECIEGQLRRGGMGQ